MIYVFLANGFEEIEALTPVDLLRRADLTVKTVGIGGRSVTGAHNITVMADIEDFQVDFDCMEALVLPGGMPGTINLENSLVVQNALATAVGRQLPVAAICAAPSILGHAGYLASSQATCYPGFEDALQAKAVAEEAVVTDGIFTTAKGAGVATDFALELIRRLKGDTAADQIRGAIQCQ